MAMEQVLYSSRVDDNIENDEDLLDYYIEKLKPDAFSIEEIMDAFGEDEESRESAVDWLWGVVHKDLYVNAYYDIIAYFKMLNNMGVTKYKAFYYNPEIQKEFGDHSSLYGERINAEDIVHFLYNKLGGQSIINGKLEKDVDDEEIVLFKKKGKLFLLIEELNDLWYIDIVAYKGNAPLKVESKKSITDKAEVKDVIKDIKNYMGKLQEDYFNKKYVYFDIIEKITFIDFARTMDWEREDDYSRVGEIGNFFDTVFKYHEKYITDIEFVNNSGKVFVHISEKTTEGYKEIYYDIIAKGPDGRRVRL